MRDHAGGVDVVVEGTVVDIRVGSGIIYRCPECRRVLDDVGECKLHGEQEGNIDLRVKGILDDGSGAVTFFLDRSNTEKMAKVTLDELLEKEKPGQSLSKRKIEDELMTKDLTLSGNAMKEEYGLTFIVKSADLRQSDLEEEARQIMSQMEGYL